MQVSFTLIDIGLIIGAVLSLLNGVELVIRPHQKKQIQDFFENVTLWLEYATIPSLKERLTDSGVRILLTTYAWFFVALLWVFWDCVTYGLQFILIHLHEHEVASILANNDVADDIKEDFRVALDATKYLHQLNWTDTIYSCILSVPLIILCFKYKKTSKVWEWILAPAEAHRIKRRARVIYWPTVLSAVLVYVALPKSGVYGSYYSRFEAAYGNYSLPVDWLSAETPIYFLASFLVINSIFVLVEAVARCGHMGAAIVAGKRSTLRLRLFVSASKFVLWRIIEYQKGTVAAIVLIVTIILGVIKVYT